MIRIKSFELERYKFAECLDAVESHKSVHLTLSDGCRNCSKFYIAFIENQLYMFAIILTISIIYLKAYFFVQKPIFASNPSSLDKKKLQSLTNIMSGDSSCL